MEQSPSCEAKRFAASQEIPRIYGTRKSITAFIYNYITMLNLNLFKRGTRSGPFGARRK